MVFEEAIFIKGSNRKKYSVEEVTQLRNHDLKTYASVKDYLFCPECEKPHLTHNLCTTKSDYFSTYNKEEHDAECSIKCKKAASRQLELLQKVYDHMDISESECFNCYLAFFAQMEMNIQNDKTYYNCILTDSRKMFWMKTDR